MSNRGDSTNKQQYVTLGEALLMNYKLVVLGKPWMRDGGRHYWGGDLNWVYQQLLSFWISLRRGERLYIVIYNDCDDSESPEIQILLSLRSASYALSSQQLDANVWGRCCYYSHWHVRKRKLGKQLGHCVTGCKWQSESTNPDLSPRVRDVGHHATAFLLNTSFPSLQRQPTALALPESLSSLWSSPSFARGTQELSPETPYLPG